MNKTKISIDQILNLKEFEFEIKIYRYHNALLFSNVLTEINKWSISRES